MFEVHQFNQSRKENILRWKWNFWSTTSFLDHLSCQKLKLLPRSVQFKPTHSHTHTHTHTHTQYLLRPPCVKWVWRGRGFLFYIITPQWLTEWLNKLYIKFDERIVKLLLTWEKKRSMPTKIPNIQKRGGVPAGLPTIET